MPAGLNRASRKAAKEAAQIPGMKSLHRGIHHHMNTESVNRFMTNTKKKRNDFRELLVHHQKINEELKDVYARTAALVKDNMTMEERKAESWRAFERIGGVKPKEKVKFAAHLKKVSEEKRTDRTRADEERTIASDTLDFNRGSATEKLRQKRVGTFVRGQVDRARKLKRMGDPTNALGKDGFFDAKSSMLNLNNKAMRRVTRAVREDRAVGAVKTRRGGQRSMWETPVHDLNRVNQRVIRDASADWRLGRGSSGGGRGGRGGRGRGGRR